VSSCRVALALASVLALGCAEAGRGPVFATSASFEQAPRKPPSFAPDPPALPDEGRFDEVAGVQRAVTPLDPEAARDVVTQFFMAVLLESSPKLVPLLATQAWATSEGNRQPAQAVWRARFAQLDYTMLSGRVVATPSTLRTYTYASAARARLDGVPAPQGPAEVIVVARPSSSGLGKTRLFGDFLAFKLRPKLDLPGYEIAEIVEDFRLP
jgi:hypothetical protein